MKRRTFIKSAGMAGAALAGGANMLPSILSGEVSAAPKPNGRPNAAPRATLCQMWPAL
jgi:TAT (twin-arginine translocation) pathway signal sequence